MAYPEDTLKASDVLLFFILNQYRNCGGPSSRKKWECFFFICRMLPHIHEHSAVHVTATFLSSIILRNLH